MWLSVCFLFHNNGNGGGNFGIHFNDANNFLIKKGLGVVATADTINSVAIKNKAIERQKAEEKQKAMDDARRLKGQVIRITASKLGFVG